MAVGIPADILTETIVTLGECIRGDAVNQEAFSRVHAPTKPPRPALILLLLSMVNEKQPFELRCAILYALQSYLHKNPLRQKEVMQTLLPQDSTNEGLLTILGSPCHVTLKMFGAVFDSFENAKTDIINHLA